METLNSGESLFSGFEVGESEASTDTLDGLFILGIILLLVILGIREGREEDGVDLTELRAQLFEVGLGHVFREVLDEDVGKLLGISTETFTTGDEGLHFDDLTFNGLTVDSGDDLLGIFFVGEVDETITEGFTLGVGGDLARENVAEDGESIVERLVVDGLSEVVDEDVTLVGLTEGGVAVRPHDTARDFLAGGGVTEANVHGIESLFSIFEAMEVDIGVTERAASDGVTADTDGGDRANSVELIVQHSFADIGIEVTNVEGGRSENDLRLSSSRSGSSSHC